MTRILLTGSTGFIGTYMSTRPEIVRRVVRGPAKSDVEFGVSNIDLNTNWDDAFVGIDTVIHLAGLAHGKFTEEDYHSVNVEGTIRLATQARKAGVKRIVYLSSVCVHGTSSGNSYFSPASPIKPNDYASNSKALTEQALQEVALATGLEVVIVRSCLVFGANAPANVKRLLNLVSKSPILPFGLVNNARSFVSIRNLVELLICCASHPEASGHIFYASNGLSLSTKELTNILARSLGKRVIQLPVPVRAMKLVSRIFGYEAVAESLLGNQVVDSSNLQEILGWTPPFTLSEEIATLKQHKVE